MNDLAEIAATSKAWPFKEAQKILKRQARFRPDKDHILLQTGYGPTGLPHIGTFGEVARTTMVRHALNVLSDLPVRVIAFADDMDGMRKIAPNLPQQEMLKRHMGMPLSKIPDPFGSNRSFAKHNTDMLQEFLDAYGFEYEFESSTACYEAGRFDDLLVKVAENYDKVMEIMLSDLREERAATYSPFLPISPTTGRVLEVPMIEIRPQDATIVFKDENGQKTEQKITGGHCKLQWRVDWALRWAAFDVDYEMYGKDLIDSARLSHQIVRVLGGTAPESFHYELFLDEDGHKISKTKGNGLTIDEWMTYASPESLAFFMYQNPNKAKRLYFDIIPKCVDDYIDCLKKFPDQDTGAQLNNAAWYIHGGEVPAETSPISFAMLLNLVSAANASDAETLQGFIGRYLSDPKEARNPLLAKLVEYAVAYYHDFVKPGKNYRMPDDKERAALDDLSERLQKIEGECSAEDLQTLVFDVGNAHDFENLRDWFRALYEILLGQSQGPRMGGFIALYGVAETVALISRVLQGEDLAADAQ